MKFSGYCLLIALVASTNAHGQVAKGTPPYGSFGGGPFDTVNLGNLNVHFAIPVLHKAGRGMPFAYDLSYDSSVWTPVTSSGTTQWQPDSNWGWRGTSEAAIGYALQTKVLASCQYFQNGRWQTDNYWTWTTTGFGDQYGVLHPVRVVTYDDTLGWCADVISSGSGTTTDGSGYTVFVTNFSQVTVTSKSGTVFNGVGSRGIGAVGSITDSNGNQITQNTSGHFFDTLSSTTPVLTVASPAPPSSTTFTYSAPSGGNAVYSMNYQQYTVQTNFGTSTMEYGPLSNSLVSGVALPDGSSYSFTYEATPGSCIPLSGTYSANCVTGRIASVTLATGGSITYAYSGGSNGIEADGSTAGLTRTLSPGGTWQYARSVSGSNSTTTITDPLLDQTVINFAKDGNPTYPSYNFYETQRQVSQLISGTQTLLETIVTCYNANYSLTACPTLAVSSPISQTDSYLELPNGSTRLAEILYNGYGLVTDDKEYDYGVTTGSAPGTTKLVRETAIAYAALGNGIVSNPSSVIVSDWSSGSAVTLASTTYTYDGGSGVTGTTGTPQHVSITGSRGNLTTLKAQTSATASLSKTYSYYDTGNLNVATDVNAAQTTYGYSTGSCGNSFPTGLTEPLSLSRSFTWSCTGGVMLTATDENGKNVTADYSTDPDFWRPDYVIDQLLNKTTLAYPGETASESTLSFNSGNSVSDFRATTDGFGRPIISQRKQSPTVTTYDSVETYYDAFGRVADTLLPYSGTSSAFCTGSCPKQIFTYDALNRPATITDSGSGSVSYQYIDNDVLQTVGPTQTFTKQMEYDGLGRLTSVCEVTAGTTAWPGGSCGQTNPQTGYLTKYTYDAIGNLLTVTQNAQATSNKQTRKYSYDMLSRVTSEVNPETGNSATGVDIAYTYDSACGSYSASSGDLTKRVDKAGNTTCYGYDAFHRLKDAGNAGPTCRHFRYDTQTPPSGVTVTNTLARQTEAYTDNCTSGKLTDEWFGYDADGRLTDFYESTPHSGGYYHTSASYWANGAIDSLSALTASSTAIFPTIYYGASTGTGLDGEGRVTKVSAASGTSPVTNVTYVTSGTTEPIGALTGVTLGSGDTDSFTFDPHTGRPLTYTFAVNSVNDNGSLIWNANGTLKTLTVADSLAGTNDSQTCNYYYDDLRRLGGKDSNGYSVDCSTTWSQLFTFDPFGNTSKSGSGGFAPTYSAATNQFTTIPGIVSPYYDANGNLTKDNLNTYAWDPNWGNPATINSSTNLIYDANGLMVEQQTGSTYTQMLYSPVGKTAIMNGQTLTKGFVNLPGGGTAIYTSTGLAYYRHADWLGSSRLTSTAARTVYSDSAYAPFGEQYGKSGTVDASFTGQDDDTISSLYDFAFREDSSSQGRWISPDPAGLGAVDPGNPQSWNRYAYVTNQPVDSIDPLGLFGYCPPVDGPYIPSSINADGTTNCPSAICPPGGWAIVGGYLVCGPPGQILSAQQGYGGTNGSGANVGGAANNGTPKSPARQQCEKNAQQKYSNMRASIPGIAVRGAEVFALGTVVLQAAAGCALGGGTGTILGGLATSFLGGEGAFGGAAVGCPTVAVSAVLDGLPMTAAAALVGGGGTYAVERIVASQELTADLQACSQVP